MDFHAYLLSRPPRAKYGATDAVNCLYSASPDLVISVPGPGYVKKWVFPPIEQAGVRCEHATWDGARRSSGKTKQPDIEFVSTKAKWRSSE
jgi:hypothetical protein